MTSRRVPKIRCPCCGMLVFLRNLRRRHKLDSYAIVIGGKTKAGKPILRYEKLDNGKLAIFWLSRLEAVMQQLKAIMEGKRQWLVIPQRLAQPIVEDLYTSKVEAVVISKPVTRVVVTQKQRR